MATIHNELTANPASHLPLNSNLAFILAIVAAALFAVGFVLAIVNLIRDKYGVHMFLALFAAERVATYVIRAILQKHHTRTLVIVFEILEAAGMYIIIVTMYHLWAGTARSRDDKVTKRGRTGHCCTLFLSTFVAAGAIAAFIAGVILQDRASATAEDIDRGLKCRKAAVIAYGALWGVLLFLTLGLFFRKGARRGALGLLLATALFAANAGFQIYAMFKRRDRYYDNEFFWPLLVLTELLALLILVTPGFVRRCLRPADTLPLTDSNGQYVVGGGNGAAQPYAPSYVPGPAIQPTTYK